MADFSWHDALSETQLAAAAQLVELAKEHDRPDGIRAELPALPAGHQGGYLLARQDRLIGYASVDLSGDAQGHQVVELIVHPDLRKQGIGKTMAELILARVDGDRVRAWSHGDHGGAAGLAHHYGMRRIREVKRLRRVDGELPEVSLPEGIRLRSFHQGKDEAAVVAVNHAAFSWHPEQSALTVADLVAAQKEPWFDPEGFFLAVDRDDRLLGFHWTKVHEATPEPIGEVYVVGVSPSAQGMGLGRVLTLAGLRHFAVLGLRRVMLYVESDNFPALRLYAWLGFTPWDADVQYGRHSVTS